VTPASCYTPQSGTRLSCEFYLLMDEQLLKSRRFTVWRVTTPDLIV